MAKINRVPQPVMKREDFSSQVGHTNQFILEREPIVDTVIVLRNGVETKEGGNTADYSLSNKTVTINFPMFANKTSLVVTYFYAQ